MITVDEWEKGEVNLTDELFKAEWEFFPMFGWRIKHYIGQDTGTVLESKFQEVLEPEPPRGAAQAEGGK